MRTWHKIVIEVKVLSGAKRNRTDLLRYLVRRRALLVRRLCRRGVEAGWTARCRHQTGSTSPCPAVPRLARRGRR